MPLFFNPKDNQDGSSSEGIFVSKIIDSGPAARTRPANSDKLLRYVNTAGVFHRQNVMQSSTSGSRLNVCWEGGLKWWLFGRETDFSDCVQDHIGC